MTFNNMMVRLQNGGALGNARYPFIATAPCPPETEWYHMMGGLSIFQIEMFGIYTEWKQMVFDK